MKKFEANSFCEFSYLSKLSANQSGKIAFIKGNGNEKENKYLSDIYLLEEDNNVKRITTSQDVKNFEWLDENHIIYPSLREERDINLLTQGFPRTVFQKVSIVDGNEEEFLRLDKFVSNIYIISENKFIFTAMYNKELEDLLNSCNNEEEVIKKLSEEKNYIVFDEIPFWTDGVGVTNKKRNRAYIYDNGKITTLSNEKINVLDVKIHKDYAVFFGSEFKEDMQETKTTIYHVDLNTLDVKNITHTDPYQHKKILPISDTEIIIYGTDMKQFGYQQDGEFLLYNIESKEVTVLDDSGNYNVGPERHSDLKYKPQPFKFAYDGNGIYFIQLVNDITKVMYLNINTKEISEISNERNYVYEMELVNSTLYFTGTKGKTGIEIQKINNEGKIKVLTDFNKVLEKFQVSHDQEITFTNKEGNTIYGWAIKPIGIEEGKKYPTILKIHGGPRTAYVPNLKHEWQYWASEGYGVIYFNPTGSSGRGNEFGDIRGKWGTVDFDDLMMFVDKTIECCPWIDSDKMGIFGASYGGFLTNWTLGHTNRFKVAISQVSMANFITEFSCASIGFFIKEEIGGTSWENNEMLWNNSPLKYVGQIKTPTLFIHAEEDHMVHYTESIQMFNALKLRGVDTKMILFKNEDHNLSSVGLPKHRIRRLEEAKKWFDKYLK